MISDEPLGPSTCTSPLASSAPLDVRAMGTGPDVRPRILVSGSTGTVGAEVVAELARRGEPVRAASRNPGLRGGTLDLVERVAFDFGRPDTFAAALAGVEVAFLVRPPALGRLSDLAPFLEAAVAAGVRHVVLLSVQGADKIPVLPHARVERWLRDSPTVWTFLRPSFFDQNLTGVHAPAIRALDEIVVPAGQGRTAFVDAVDVALAAAGILAEPAPHAGRAYTLTGSEALTYAEVAALLTEICGRPVRYRAPGLLRYLVRARTELDLPPALVAATSVVYTTARLGLAAGRTDELARLLGRPPTTLREFVERERASFLP